MPLKNSVSFLKSVDNNPYPGFLISKDLKWANDVDKITKNASLMIGFLRRTWNSVLKLKSVERPPILP